jgi:ureidoacrylate peracid hydrolase
MFTIQTDNHTLKPALLIIDVQNGFVSKGGSYDLLGMETSNYREIIPKIRDLINLCKNVSIPIFYTQAVRESSGIDLLTNTHKILPKAREERIRKNPLCVRGTWDAQTIDEIKPTEEDHIIIKRRDSAFQDTELRVWLQSVGINTLIFCGVDTSICVETSLRDGFNLGYDVILISDATSSGMKKHYETTLERVHDYYGLVMDLSSLKKMLNVFESVSKGEMEIPHERMSEFLEKHKLLDLRSMEKVKI